MKCVLCTNNKCRFLKNGFCTQDEIKLNKYGGCETFESFTTLPEYQNYYYKRVKAKNGKIYKRLARGKEIRYGGFIFYTETPPNETRITVTECRTGYDCGFLDELKTPSKWVLFMDFVADKTDVANLPFEP